MDRNMFLSTPSAAPTTYRRNVIFHELTQREHQVLALVAHGWENKEIARELHISTFTVQNHLQKMYRTLGISNRTEAARLYWQRTGQGAASTG